MTDRDDVLAVWRRQLDAMDAGDAEAIVACYTPDAVLVHMTGYAQPLAEWLDGVRRGQLVYHRLVEHSVEVLAIGGDTARVAGHVTTGITDDGSGRAWPLLIDQDYRMVEGGWRCTTSRVSFDR